MRRFILGAVLILPAAVGTAAGDVASRTLTLAGPDEPGTRLLVMGTVVDADGQPVAKAEVLAYHTDARGWYTRDKVMDEGNARLKGRVRTGPDGGFEIRTIRPGAYPAGDGTPESRRIPQHIHLEITADGFAKRRLQLVFEDDPRMTDYWQGWARRANHPVAKVTALEDGTQVCEPEVRLER